MLSRTYGNKSVVTHVRNFDVSDNVTKTVPKITKEKKTAHVASTGQTRHANATQPAKVTVKSKPVKKVFAKPSKYAFNPTEVLIRNLAPHVTASDLMLDVLVDDGVVSQCILHVDAQNKPTGAAHITFDYKEEAMAAVAKHNGAVYNNKPLRLTMLGSQTVAQPKSLQAAPPRVTGSVPKPVIRQQVRQKYDLTMTSVDVKTAKKRKKPDRIANTVAPAQVAKAVEFQISGIAPKKEKPKAKIVIAPVKGKQSSKSGGEDATSEPKKKKKRPNVKKNKK